MNIELNQLKLQFNNDIIKLKKLFLQARVQTINKLSKKCKYLKSKEYPDTIKEKFDKKVEAFVTEINILKKLDLQDTVRFGVANFEKLMKFIDTPEINKEKACARICTHKSLKPKLQILLKKFSMVALEKLVEINPVKVNKKIKKEKLKKIKKAALVVTVKDENNTPETNEEIVKEIMAKPTLIKEKKAEKPLKKKPDDEDEISEIKSDNDPDPESGCSEDEDKQIQKSDLDPDEEPEVKPEPKPIELSKKKKKFKMLCDANAVDDSEMEKNEDSFFVTNSGDKYLSVASQRPPDKTVNDQSNNRKMRRAAMFGYEPLKKIRKPPRLENFERKIPEYNPTTEETLHPSWAAKKQKSSIIPFQGKKTSFDREDTKMQPKEEKLHPSWEAKKQKQAPVAFQGKKILFDE